MPSRFVSVGELDSHVFMPIARQLLYGLIADMNYTDIFSDRIYFKGDFTNDSEHGTDKGIPHILDNRVECTIQPVMNPASVKWAPYQSNYRMGVQFGRYDFSSSPIFTNNDINTYVREGLIPSSLVLDIKFTLLGRSNAYDLLNRLYTKYATGEMIILSDVVFDYKLPDEIASLLFYLYRLCRPSTETDAVYTSKFMTWLDTYSKSKIALIKNRYNADRKELVIKKTAFRLVGQLDLSSDKPDANKTDQTTNSYTISVTYTSQFNRPCATIVDFPVICNNTLVSSKYLSIQEKDYNPKYPTYQNEIVNTAKIVQQPTIDGYVEYINLPWYDDWKVPYNESFIGEGFSPFIVQAFTLDDANNTAGVTTIKLSDGFDQYTLKDSVLASLAASGNYALYPDSTYMIQVYANNALVDPASITFDGDTLTIKNRNKLKQYHLVISKHEVNDGANKIKRCWITDLICERK